MSFIVKVKIDKTNSNNYRKSIKAIVKKESRMVILTEDEIGRQNVEIRTIFRKDELGYAFGRITDYDIDNYPKMYKDVVEKLLRLMKQLNWKQVTNEYPVKWN